MMIRESFSQNPEPMDLTLYSQIETKRESKVEEESVETSTKKNKVIHVENQDERLLSLPIDIIKEIFSYIQDSSTRASVLETCRLLYSIGSQTFTIQDKDGSCPIVEKLMERIKKGQSHPVLSGLLNKALINMGYQERMILPWAIRNRQVKIERLIIKNPEFNPLAQSGGIFKLACRYSGIETVKLLLKHSRLKEKISNQLANDGLLVASAYGQSEVVKLLLTDKEFKVLNSSNILLRASQYGHTEVVKVLLEMMKNQIDESLLLEAIKTSKTFHCLETLQFLLKHLQKLDQEPNQNDTAHKEIIYLGAAKKEPLYEKACSKFNVKVKNSKNYPSSIECLMQEKGVEGVLNLLEKKISKEYKTRVLLPWACRKGILEVVKAILEDSKAEFIKIKFASNALKWASTFGHTDVVRVILKTQKDFFTEKNLPKLIDPAIDLAIENGYTETVQTILENCPKQAFNVEYKVGKASQNGHTEVVKLLLADKRVDPSANGNSTFIVASQNGHTEAVKILLADKRVNPSAKENMAIFQASQNGHTEVVKLLLADKRVNPSAKENLAIFLASKNGHIKVVKLLLADPRVDPSAKENLSIQLASQSGHTEVVKLLLADPRVDPSTKDNLTIRLASQNGHTEVVKLLLTDNRVNPFAEKNLAVRLARRNGHTEVVQHLSADPRFVELPPQMVDTLSNFGKISGNRDSRN